MSTNVPVASGLSSFVRVPEKIKIRLDPTAHQFLVAVALVPSTDERRLTIDEVRCDPTTNAEGSFVSDGRLFHVFKTYAKSIDVSFIINISSAFAGRVAITVTSHFVGGIGPEYLDEETLRENAFVYPRQFSLKDATAIETRKSLGDLGHWTQVELKEVGPDETLKWHTKEGIAEWMRVQEQVRALGPALAPYARDHGEIAAAHQYVLQTLLRAVRAYKDPTNTALIDELMGIKKQDILKRIEWLTRIAEQEMRKVA